MVSNATKDIIKTVYSSNKKLPINKRQLKKIEKFFINNADLTSDIIQAMKQEKSIGDCIDVLKSGKDEIVKQHAKQKGLQSGILSECLIAQTLADIHELEFYEDIETNAPSSTLLSLVKDNKLEHLLGNTRYVYYSQQKEIIIFQCGNPNTNDLHIHLKAGDVISEIKDIPALIQDIDLLYDNNGKLIIPDELRKQSPACAEVIERFNAEQTYRDVRFLEWSSMFDFNMSNPDATTEEKKEVAKQKRQDGIDTKADWFVKSADNYIKYIDKVPKLQAEVLKKTIEMYD